MFHKILIANRGEIACRIIKTARRMGIETVAVYSTADRDSLHVTMADHAICIGEPQASASYLNIDAIINAAVASGAEAIHPGYGFLSENPDFAKAVTAAGMIFIGPSVSAMEAMASKQLAKQRLETTDVPLTPGYHGNDQADNKLLSEAIKIGFPVLLKPASGGGGKGMRAVYDEAEFIKDVAAARREATASFGDDTLLIEKLLINPRHIEIQIMADNHGNVVHLFDRDCSIQRRHQKIIEEAPAPNLSDDLRHRLGQAAITVAQAINYRSAGTIEFLVDKHHNFYFMEMNTRLQVEHPVTEMITGLDLVEWQLRIAANEPLPCLQQDISCKGHAIECRIYAEDPNHDFLPSMGVLHYLKEPINEGIRIDTGVALHSEISQYYDPMIAKLIAWGRTREEALARLYQALKHYHIGGVKTNLGFLQTICQHPSMIEAKVSTDFLSQHDIKPSTPNARRAALMAAGVDYIRVRANNDSQTFAWQMHLPLMPWCSRYLIDNETYTITVTPLNKNQLSLEMDGETVHWYVELRDGYLRIENSQHTSITPVEILPNASIFYTETGPVRVDPFKWEQQSQPSDATKHRLTAPMPATVVAILKQKDDKVIAGERLMVLEAMKMEHTIQAPHDGLLIDIFFEVGAQVNEGAELVRIK